MSWWQKLLVVGYHALVVYAFSWHITDSRPF